MLAANEGRSFVDAVDVSTGKLLDRLAARNSTAENVTAINISPNARFTTNLISLPANYPHRFREPTEKTNLRLR